MKPTLVTWAFKDIIRFTVVQFAAKVSTFSRKSPAEAAFVKKDKIPGYEISRQGQLRGYFYIVWFLGNTVPDESYDGVEKSKGHKIEQKAASFSICTIGMRL